jgi:uncharacterized protein
MHRRSGSADLPLHGGRVPAWLAVRMAALGRVIVEAIVHEYGRDELLLRLAHPFWFQSFGSVMGMDWHSSGITTSVVGALKRGLRPIQNELGVYVCGGRGAHSRQTPSELMTFGSATGIDAGPLVRTSRLVAKVDNAVVQDGYQLYLHAFFVTKEGKWCVVQQGMNEARREARRYHWQSEGLTGFFDSPHSAINGRNVGRIVNLADVRAARSRSALLSLVHAGPDRAISLVRDCMLASVRRRSSLVAQYALELAPTSGLPLPHLHLPRHHEVMPSDVMLRRLHATLASAAERGPADFADLLLIQGVGARTVSALTFVAEVIHGAPCRFSDPARFALAHGGKDGHPFPVPVKVYDETITVLKRAVTRAKLGRGDTLSAIRQLDAQARALEGRVSGPGFDEFLAGERARSREYGGATAFQPPTAMAR